MQEETKILIKACIRKERQAQGALYKLYSPKMYAVCLRYLKNEADAQDTLQESFILAFDKIGQFSFNGSFEGWLRRLTVNVCLGRLRKKTFFVVADERIQEESEPSYEWEEEEPKMSFKELEALIEEMPKSYYTVFNMYLIEEYSHKEIAEMLGISEGTSKSNLSRGKAWLRKKIKKKNLNFHIINERRV